jgi:fumarylpyruvate hydrolase
MNDFVFPTLPQTSVAVHGTGKRFPVHRIYCIGRNYEAHVREMGHDPDRSPPIFFCKPADAILEPDASGVIHFPYPSATENLHYEAELVVAIGQGGRDIDRQDARSHVFGYAVGLDMTRRDLQRAAAKAGQPWETGKAFDGSAPLGAIVPVKDGGHPSAGELSLTVNGQVRQKADLEQLIWGVEDIIAELSRLFELQPGDLIFTGTPEGVGEVRPGDRMVCRVEQLGQINVTVESASPARGQEPGSGAVLA